MESKTQKSLIRTNIKKISLVVIGYKLVCVNDKFNKPFKTYLGEDSVHNFMNIMIEDIDIVAI